MINIMFDNGTELNIDMPFSIVEKLLLDRPGSLTSVNHWYGFGNNYVFVNKIVWIKEVK